MAGISIGPDSEHTSVAMIRDFAHVIGRMSPALRALFSFWLNYPQLSLWAIDMASALPTKSRLRDLLHSPSLPTTQKY